MSRKTQLTLGRQDDQNFILSTVPSTYDDVKQLEERFDMLLYKEFALETGLCPKRRRTYDDLFNELVRVIKVHCSERGLLLERVKNEYNQWMTTYEELYSSSIAYGIRQYLYKLEENKRLESEINTLENDCQQLREELEEEKINFRKISRAREHETKEQRTLRDNVKILQSTNKKLRENLEETLNQILASPIFLGESNDYQ